MVVCEMVKDFCLFNLMSSICTRTDVGVLSDILYNPWAINDRQYGVFRRQFSLRKGKWATRLALNGKFLRVSSLRRSGEF